MHVGLNLLYLVPGETGGTETYARRLIPALRAAAPDVRLTAFVNREAAEAGGGPWDEEIPAVTVPVRSRRRTEWVRGEQQLLPGLAARAGCDLLHSLANTAPLWGHVRRIVTIHDLFFRVAPEAHFGAAALGMRVLVPAAARTSTRVLTPSQTTRDDLLRFHRIDPARVDAVLEGVEEPPPSGDAAAARARHGLGERPVLLALSAKRPHKNLERLLAALARLPLDRRPVLVLPGYPTPHEAELRRAAAALGVAGDVRMPGWVGAAEVEDLFAAARAFVMPSLYEGFGLPVLEAMSRGVPVACSDGGALAEVAGGAAAVFDPLDVRAITTALERVLGDEAERGRLVAAGHRRAGELSWERTAEGTLRAYRAAIGAA